MLELIYEYTAVISDQSYINYDILMVFSCLMYFISKKISCLFCFVKTQANQASFLPATSS